MKSKLAESQNHLMSRKSPGPCTVTAEMGTSDLEGWMNELGLHITVD